MTGLEAVGRQGGEGRRSGPRDLSYSAPPQLRDQAESLRCAPLLPSVWLPPVHVRELSFYVSPWRGVVACVVSLLQWPVREDVTQAKHGLPVLLSVGQSAP